MKYAWIIRESDGTSMTAVPRVVAVAGSEETAARLVSEARGYNERHAEKVELVP